MSSRKLPRWLTRLLAAPAYVYDCDAGWLLGRRFVRLTHVGRRSGRVYRTMLEVVGEEPAAGEVFVMAGLGRSAEWYRNVVAGHAVEIAIARERFRPTYRELQRGEAVGVLAGYERRNRLIAALLRPVLSRLVGWRYDGTPAARWRLVSELPMVAFRPAT
jgi:deazaflavin-dependent oxidoreductase (nitroreductase family)